MLKKLFFLNIFFLCFFGQMAYPQCQLCYLDFNKAKESMKEIQKRKEVILFSGCEYNDIARRVKVDSVYFLPVKNIRDKYELFIKGRIIAFFRIQEQEVNNYTGASTPIEESVDISYVHIKTGGTMDKTLNKLVYDATCLCVYLNYECDPCVDPFDYPTF